MRSADVQALDLMGGLRVWLDRNPEHSWSRSRKEYRMISRKLRDMLNGNGDSFANAWAATKAADDYGTPLPAGEYVAQIVDGQLTTAKAGTPAYKLIFRILKGEHAGRRFWLDLWLTPAAMPMTKRDLLKIGVTDLDALELPLRRGVRCRVRLALRRDDDGNEANRVQSFEVVDIGAAESDAFAPMVQEVPA